MTPFVLVHGAWHGGWAWDAVGERLRARGHPVFAPTLTGMSEDRANFSRRIDLETHTDDVVRLIETHDLRDIHLVGWSYAGMVLTGVLSRMPERIAQLSYFDAFLPMNGESLADFFDWRTRATIQFARVLGRGLPVLDPAETWGVRDEAVLAFARPKLSPQPPATFTQRAPRLAAWPEHVEYAYVWCAGDPNSTFAPFYELAVADRRFRTARIEEGHCALMTHPDLVLESLVPTAES